MAYRNSGMYNPACPQTPAPARAGPRFPMSAAILETPSIMSSFRESACPKKPTPAPLEPPAMQFIPPYTSSSWNDSMMFSGSTSLPQTGAPTWAKTQRTQQGFNNSFLDSSFNSTFNNPSSTGRKLPLAPSNTNASLNRSMMAPQKSFSAPSTPRFPTLANFHRPQGTNLNSTMPLFNSNTSFAKRKYPESASTAPSGAASNSKYSKISPVNQKALPAAAVSSPEQAKGNADAKATLRIVSGTIDHIQKVIRERPTYPLLLETVANVVTVKPGTKPKEKLLLLRNGSSGPVLQGLYYEIDADLPPFVAGDLVRCVGRIQPVGNRFQILKITRTSEQHGRAIARLQTVSAFTTKVRR